MQETETWAGPGAVPTAHPAGSCPRCHRGAAVSERPAELGMGRAESGAEALKPPAPPVVFLTRGQSTQPLSWQGHPDRGRGSWQGLPGCRAGSERRNLHGPVPGRHGASKRGRDACARRKSQRLNLGCGGSRRPGHGHRGDWVHLGDISIKDSGSKERLPEKVGFVGTAFGSETGAPCQDFQSLGVWWGWGGDPLSYK